MLDLVVLMVAVFWAWETLRYALQTYLPNLFSLSRPVHPLIVLALPLWLLWPDWVPAMAVAGAVAILHVVMERLGQETSGGTPIQLRRRQQRGGLPDLP